MFGTPYFGNAYYGGNYFGHYGETVSAITIPGPIFLAGMELVYSVHVTAASSLTVITGGATILTGLSGTLALTGTTA